MIAVSMTWTENVRVQFLGDLVELYLGKEIEYTVSLSVDTIIETAFRDHLVTLPFFFPIKEK